MALSKLSAIANGGATAGATDTVVAVRSGTTDVLVTPVALDTAQNWTAPQTFVESGFGSASNRFLAASSVLGLSLLPM